MSKIRIYDLAKETNKPSKEIMEMLADFGVEVKSASSSIEQAEADKVRNALSGKTEKAAKIEKIEVKPAAVKPKQNFPIVKIKQGASVSDVAAAVGEKAGKAVKMLMSAGLMLPATTAADEKVLAVLGEGFGKTFVFGEDTPAAEMFEEVEEIRNIPKKFENKPSKKAEKKAEKRAEKKAEKQAAKQPEKQSEEIQYELTPRPPIITVM